MKKVFLYPVILLTLLSGLVSCDDFLKEDPRGRVTDLMAFRQKEDLYGALYSMNHIVIRATKAQLMTSPWIAGDDITTHSASNKGPYREFDVFTASDANEHLNNNNGHWFWCWRVVKAANFILNGADRTSGVSQEEIDFVKGQAHYWRAWAYFNLVRLWGPVPMLKTGDIDWEVAPAKVSEIFDLIVSDMQEAEKLPVKYEASPWALNGVNVVVSRGAAQASLAYIYLYMAGWPLEYGTEYYRLAAAKALEVINATENGTYYYALYDEYRLLHSRQENLKNKELIMGVYFSSITGDGDDSQAFRATIGDIHQVSGGNHNFRGEFGFYYDFPEGDRKEWTYAPVTYHVAAGQAYEWWHAEIPLADRQPYFRKSLFTQWSSAYADREWDVYMLPSSQGAQWSTQTAHVVRLAEVYCWYAEAIGRSGETNPRAIELLNKVRNRANGASVADRDIYPSSMTPNDLAEAAYNEHGWEIAGWVYGSIAPRFSDLQRMNRVKNHYERRMSNPRYPHPVPDSGVPDFYELFNPVEPWSNEKMYLPYPSEDKRKNPNLVNVNKLNLIK